MQKALFLPYIHNPAPSYYAAPILKLKPYLWEMEVNDALVSNLANLSKLRFNAAEKEIIKQDLQRMIAFVDKLQELDTSGVEPLLHMSDSVNRLRADVVSGSISREEALKNAPQTDGTYLRVPKVIRKDQDA